MFHDIRVFWLIGALASGICGFVVLFVRRSYPDYLGRSLALFGLANLCLCLNYAFHLGRALLGEFAFYVLGGTMVTMCLGVEYAAVSVMNRRRAGIGIPAVFSALTFLCCSWFLLMAHNASIAVMLCNLLNAIVMGMIAWNVLKAQKNPKMLADRMAGIAYCFLALSTLGVFLQALHEHRFTADYDFNGPRSLFTNTVALLAQGIVFPLFLLMLSARLNRTLVEQASYDSLTGIYNRRAFEEIAFRQLSGAARSGESYSLLLLDLDHFKDVNDRYGHLGGDALLCAAAATLRSMLRDEDFLCRWGGDEFCALLPRAGYEQAELAARRIVAAFVQLQLEYEGSILLTTVSVGIACSPVSGTTVSELIRKADAALFEVKRSGRSGFALASA